MNALARGYDTHPSYPSVGASVHRTSKHVSDIQSGGRAATDGDAVIIIENCHRAHTVFKLYPISSRHAHQSWLLCRDFPFLLT